MRSWARLSPRGDLQPLDRPTGVPAAVAELVALHGVGWLVGLFEVVEPHGARWDAWNAQARLLRSRGYFAGLDAATFEASVVFARDRAGHALLSTADGAFHLLTCAGAVLPLGGSVDELLDRLPSRASLLFPSLERVWNGIDWVPKHDWGLELTYVAPSYDGRSAYIAALLAGEDADARLEGALAGEPLALALHALLARLCAPSTDRLRDEVRADALQPLLAMARRRFGTLPGVPPGLFAAAPFRDPAVRAWAESQRWIDLRPGPFVEELAKVEAMPCVEPIPEDARPPLEAPCVDCDAVLARWLVAWDSLPASAALTRVRALVEAMPLPHRFAVVRRLVWDRWSAEEETPPLTDGSRALLDAAVPHHELDLSGAHLSIAWSVVLVYLVFASRFRHETSRPALAALDGVRDEDLGRALVALVEAGWEWAAMGARLAHGAPLDDAALDRLLPTLKTKGAAERVVALVMGRMDDERVYELAIASLKKWPRAIAPSLTARPGPRTTTALRALLTAKNLEVREAVAKALAALGDAEGARVYAETARRIDESV